MVVDPIVEALMAADAHGHDSHAGHAHGVSADADRRQTAHRPGADLAFMAVGVMVGITTSA